MSLHVSFVCQFALAIGAVLMFPQMSCKSIAAQELDDPFKGKEAQPFQPGRPDVPLAPINADPETMRFCLKMAQVANELGALQGKRAAIEERGRIEDSRGDGNAIKRATNEVQALIPRITRRQKDLSQMIDSAKWGESARAELEAWAKSVQDDQTETVLKIERLKLAVQWLTEENERLRQAAESSSKRK